MEVAASPRDLGLNVFDWLQGSMDASIWQRVSTALADVLDPANGGDVRLWNLLQGTLQADQERRERRPA
jgi:hypothetical protein